MLVFVMLIISLLFKAVTIYAQTRFLLIREYTISKRLVQNYLHQPYDFFKPPQFRFRQNYSFRGQDGYRTWHDPFDVINFPVYGSYGNLHFIVFGQSTVIRQYFPNAWVGLWLYICWYEKGLKTFGP